jgi:hypothetical protein
VALTYAHEPDMDINTGTDTDKDRDKIMDKGRNWDRGQ